jgi:hypothetical protein
MLETLVYVLVIVIWLIGLAWALGDDDDGLR